MKGLDTVAIEPIVYPCSLQYLSPRRTRNVNLPCKAVLHGCCFLGPFSLCWQLALSHCRHFPPSSTTSQSVYYRSSTTSHRIPPAFTM